MDTRPLGGVAGDGETGKADAETRTSTGTSKSFPSDRPRGGVVKTLACDVQEKRSGGWPGALVVATDMLTGDGDSVLGVDSGALLQSSPRGAPHFRQNEESSKNQWPQEHWLAPPTLVGAGRSGCRVTPNEGDAVMGNSERWQGAPHIGELLSATAAMLVAVLNAMATAEEPAQEVAERTPSTGFAGEAALLLG
mmetsp:Transcript_20648/g.57549  ORF Transcript_20648/g.57549 Transcript_20648/m.57549 type:complete len:194 (+) Transcript_20648:209-790(+)